MSSAAGTDERTTGAERLQDSFGRTLDYLRLSVTDRCNFRCVYCVPAAGLRYFTAHQTLDDAEILFLVSRLVQAGIRRVRVTGGEPLTRPGITELIGGIARVPGVREVSLTSNGFLLSKLARPLAEAGLGRINVSLDTLKRDRFIEVARVDGLAKVLQGLEAAIDAGLGPVKLNVVVMRGTNDDEIPDFVRLAKEMPVHVRFIELMPMGKSGLFSERTWLPIDEIRERCGALEPLSGGAAPKGAGPASYYSLGAGAKGTVGFIGALSRKFCGSCNRLRLTSTGELLSCLAQRGPGAELGRLLRSGYPPERIMDSIREVVRRKTASHQMSPGSSHLPETSMCSVGG